MFKLFRGSIDMQYPTKFGQNRIVNSLARASQTSFQPVFRQQWAITQLVIERQHLCSNLSENLWIYTILAIQYKDLRKYYISTEVHYPDGD